MYENLQVVGWLWHISFTGLCFCLWHQLVGFKWNDIIDYLIPVLFVTLGWFAFNLIVVGVPIRYLTARLKKWPVNRYWMYQARGDWVGGALAWVGYWFGVFAALYVMVTA